jgi:hypothetical protein
MANFWRDDPKVFDSIFYDSETRLLIKAAAESDFQEYGEISLEEYEESYLDVAAYSDYLFEELDFELIPELHNRRMLGDVSLESYLGINLDFYFELLPRDIQNVYKTEHITLTGEVSAMLNYIKTRIEHGNLYKLFWENEKPVNEERIQLIMENIMDAYFYNQEIDISREAVLGNGQVDFKLYRSKHEDEKILIELKKANSSSYLKKGYERQLTEYMLVSKYKNAFYLVACFNDKEYERIEQFIRKHIYTDTIQLYINISILDLRERKSPSIS